MLPIEEFMKVKLIPSKLKFTLLIIDAENHCCTNWYFRVEVLNDYVWVVVFHGEELVDI